MNRLLATSTVSFLLLAACSAAPGDPEATTESAVSRPGLPTLPPPRNTPPIEDPCTVGEADVTWYSQSSPRTLTASSQTTDYSTRACAAYLVDLVHPSLSPKPPTVTFVRDMALSPATTFQDCYRTQVHQRVFGHRLDLGCTADGCGYVIDHWQLLADQTLDNGRWNGLSPERCEQAPLSPPIPVDTSGYDSVRVAVDIYSYAADGAAPTRSVIDVALTAQ